MILFSSKDSVVLKNGPSPENDMLISPRLEKLMSYINKNWNKSLTFKPENWCIYQSAMHQQRCGGVAQTPEFQITWDGGEMVMGGGEMVMGGE